jgi:hypothetical protein
MKTLALILSACVLLGCDIRDRVSRLEKQTKEMQEQRNRITDYDLRQKCANDARTWFGQNWSRDQNTILLDFTNHYSKKENTCFILVEYHHNSNFAGPNGTSWTNDMSLYDVQENRQYGEFVENHYSYFKPKFSSSNEVTMCSMQGQKCGSLDEFNKLVAGMMNN